jgi:hypothetical protein
MLPDPHEESPASRTARCGYGTCAQLVNELVEAADERVLSRVVARYGRLDLLLLEELGYVQIDIRGAELLFQIIAEREELFQIIAEREERASIGLASNLPFSNGESSSRPAAGRRLRRPHHLQRPHSRNRHRVLPTAHLQAQPEGQPGNPGNPIATLSPFAELLPRSHATAPWHPQYLDPRTPSST